MVGFLIRRTGQAIFVLFLVTVATLAMVHLFPGGPVRALLGERATPIQIAYYNHLYGFDQPFYVQYLKWVDQLIHGNLGFSNHLNQSVTSLIAQCLPRTIVLVLLGTIVSLLFGIPLGVYQAVRRNSVSDYVLTGVSFLGYSTPTFFLGILVVDWFAVDVHIFPPFAPQGTTIPAILGTRGRWCCRCSPTPSCSTRSGPGTCARRCSTTWCRTTCGPPGPRARASAG